MDTLNSTAKNINEPFDISIVIPVHNGGEYIRECIQSIYSQTIQPAEILVFENSSTDNTVNWLKSLNDSRINILPAASFLPIDQNWDRIKMIPRKNWMTILGHDDILKPNYIETIKHLIEKHPDASLYQPHFDFIDENGDLRNHCDPMPEVQTMPEFFKNTLNNGAGFVMRSADYDAVGGIPMYPGFFFTDFALWMKLAAISYKATAPDNCFSYRHHRKNTSSVSAVNKFTDGLEAFLNYLYELKQTDAAFSLVLKKHVKTLIQLYVKSLSHRLLREEIKARNNYTVMELVDKFTVHLKRLTDDDHAEMASDKQIKIALIIDSNSITRKLFLVFKKLFPGPIFKK